MIIRGLRAESSFMKTKRAIAFATALLAGACVSSPARSSVTVPLEIPEPPPRVAMDPVPAVVAEETPAVPEQPTVTPAEKTTAPRTPPAASNTAPAAPPAAQLPVTVPEPPRTTPPPELRPAGAAGRTPTAAQVRDRMARTKQKLDLIDRSRLNAGKRADYDSALRFLSQAEGAVKDNNLLLAESSVEKAETLADGLR
jgi:hypothetical protein